MSTLTMLLAIALCGGGPGCLVGGLTIVPVAREGWLLAALGVVLCGLAVLILPHMS